MPYQVVVVGSTMMMGERRTCSSLGEVRSRGQMVAQSTFTFEIYGALKIAHYWKGAVKSKLLEHVFYGEVVFDANANFYMLLHCKHDVKYDLFVVTM